MKTLRMFAVLLSFVTFSFELSAETTAKLVEQLRTALQEESQQSKKAGADPQNRMADEMAPRILSQIDALVRRNDGQTSEALSNIASYSRSEKVRDLVSQLVEALRTEREKKEAAMASEVEKTLQQAGETVLHATSVKELDPVLQSIGRLREVRYQNNYEMANLLQNRIEGAVQLVTRWQDYLMQQSLGNQKAAQDIMRNLASSLSAPSIVPRSEVLARSQGGMDVVKPDETAKLTQQADQITEGIKTLDDIQPALKQLRVMKSSDSSTRIDSDLVNALGGLQKNYLEYKAGLPANLNLSISSPEAAAVVLPLKSQLFMLVLPRFCQTNNKPKPGEQPLDYLQRLLSEAKEKQDWPLYARVVEAFRMVNSSSSSGGWSSSADNNTSALTNFLAGLNQEQASQFYGAAQSYKQALTSGNTYVPAQFIGERLKAIQQEHGKEIEEEAQKADTRMQQRFLNNPMYRGPYPFQQPSVPPQPTPPTSMNVPAVTPIPSPLASPKPGK